MLKLDSSLCGKLLIAQPNAQSSFFSQSVVLVVQHTDQQGAWGLVINKPSMVADVQQVCEAFDLKTNLRTEAYVGGPVHNNNVHIIHTGDVIQDNSIQINKNIWVTSSISLLDDIVQDRGPHRWRLCLGTSSWTPGQLEGEQSGTHPWTPQHKWLTMPVPLDIMEKPVQSLWKDSVLESVKQSVDTFF